MKILLLLCVLPDIVIAGKVGEEWGYDAPAGQKLLWRHGDRGPTRTFKNDSYNVSHWDNGYEQLTNYGMEQHHKLGQWIKQRYVQKLNFLPQKFNGDSIKIQSSAYNRTCESALYNFKGLYGDDIEHNILRIYTPQVTNLDMVGMPFMNCDYGFSLMATAMKTKEVVEYVKKNKKLINMLSNATGYKPLIPLLLGGVTDSIVYENNKGLKLAPEYEKVINDIQSLNVQAFRFAYDRDISPQSGIDWHYELTKVHSGAMLNIIFNDFIEKANSSINPLKYRVFSAHDVNILGFLSSLGFEKLDYNRDRNTETAAAISVELWRNEKTNERCVKILYRRSQKEIFDLSNELVVCQADNGIGCKLEEFIKGMKKFLIGNEAKYCAQEIKNDKERIDPQAVRREIFRKT